LNIKSLCAIGFLMAVAAVAAPPTLTAVTFNEDVLPVLQKNCQTCHGPGEVAPMSLLTYQDARPYAKAIKTAILQKKMPPWSADPKYGHFSNERKLTDQEINTLVAWADNGAVEGEAKDRPAPVQFSSGWQIKPDVIVEMPKDQDIPATGIIDNYYVIVKGNFTEDTWLTAAEVPPSNRGVVHHVRVCIRPPGTNWLRGAEYGVPVPLNFRGTPNQGGPTVGGPAPTGSVQEILAKYNPGWNPRSSMRITRRSWFRKVPTSSSRPTTPQPEHLLRTGLASAWCWLCRPRPPLCDRPGHRQRELGDTRRRQQF
jgi:hypothetical protein